MIRTQVIVGVLPETEMAEYTASLETSAARPIFGFHAFEAILTYLTGTKSRFYQLVAPTLSACRAADPAKVLRIPRTTVLGAGARFPRGDERVQAQDSCLAAAEAVHEIKLGYK